MRFEQGVPAVALAAFEKRLVMTEFEGTARGYTCFHVVATIFMSRNSGIHV
jgi:hypothetical protein